MTNDAIRRIALQWLNRIVERRSVPAGVGSDPGAQEAEKRELVEAIADAIPQGLSIDEISDTLKAGVQRVREMQKHRSWPRTDELRDGVRVLFGAVGAGDRHPRFYDPRVHAFCVRFIRRGVKPPTQVWRPAYAEFLLAEGMVTLDELERTQWLTPDIRREMGLPPRQIDPRAREAADSAVAAIRAKAVREKRLSLEEHRMRQEAFSEQLREEDALRGQLELAVARARHAATDKERAHFEAAAEILRAKLRELAE